MGARDAGLVGMDAAFQPQRRDDLRDHRLVAVFADSHLDLVGEIDALDLLQKAMDEVLPGLFALGDDVDAGIFLKFYCQHGGVALGARQFVAFGFPGRPQRIGLGQPFGLRQRAGDRGWKQHLARILGVSGCLAVYLPCSEEEVQDHKGQFRRGGRQPKQGVGSTRKR